MSVSRNISISGHDESLTFTFSEASPEQRDQTSRLTWIAFGAPLPLADHLEREEFLLQCSINRNDGMRYWCLSIAKGHREGKVIASCKTVHRDLLVRDEHGCREEQGYCVASVVTDPDYRNRGVQTALLAYVAEWMDGEGGSTASTLYTSVGDFYVKRGWPKLPSTHAVITLPTARDPTPREWPNRPRTRLLSGDDIPALCAQDIHEIKSSLEKLQVNPDETFMVVLPTANVVTCMHDRGDFIATKRFGKKTEFHGAITDDAKCWLYWHHDFRKSQLMVQRIRVLATGVEGVSAGENSIQAIGSLLFEAVKEARRWDLLRVTIWGPTTEVVAGLELLGEKLGLPVESGEQGGSVPSLRWNGGENRNVRVLLNEHFAWT